MPQGVRCSHAQRATDAYHRFGMEGGRLKSFGARISKF